MYNYVRSILFFALLLLCMVGVQSQTYTLGINEVPIYDICANGGDALSCSNHGSCVNGACVCRDGYTGRDCSMPPGGFNFPNPMPKARATKFANLDGSDGQLEQTTCFGNFPGGQWVSRSYLPPGVTGIAAVNPTLYGSRFAYGSPNQYTPKTVTGSYAGVGQSCGQCFNLTRGSNSAIVMVVNRCGGFCRANSAVGPCSVSGATSTDCGYCVTPTTTPTTVGCSCMSQMAIQTNGYCDATSTANHCDHCAANDHPHFDLDTDSLNHLCGDSNAGVCNLDSFQWVQCGGIQAISGSYPNGNTPYTLPSNVVSSGGSSTTSKPSAPTPAPTQRPAPPAPTQKPTPAPTQKPNPAPTQRPAPTQKPTQAPTQKPAPTQRPVPTQKPTTAPAPTQKPAAPTQHPAPTNPPAAKPTSPPNTGALATACAVEETGYMRCSGTSTYQTCAHEKWQANQACGTGLVCEPAPPYIYCVRG